nr:ribosomal protein S3 [Follicularia botryoides]
MGQKIHPLGFRVGITKSHQSQWFARFHKRKYAQTVLEDRLLRQTLLKLFPDLLNPVLKKAQKREGTTEVSAQITHIKIERGLIPYEIGIQIHAGNCELIKTAIDHLEVNQNLLHNLQKTRRYILDLKSQFKESSSLEYTKQNKSQTAALLDNQAEATASLLPSKAKQNRFVSKRSFRIFKNSRFNFRRSLLENMMILKKGKKMTRKLQKRFYTLLASSKRTGFGTKQNKTTGAFRGSNSFAGPAKQMNTAKQKQTSLNAFSKKSFIQKNKGRKFGAQPNSVASQRALKNRKLFVGTNKAQSALLGKQMQSNVRRAFGSAKQQQSYLSIGQSASTRAFVDLFVSKMSQKFVQTLKSQMNHWNRFLKAHKEEQIQKYGTLRFAPLGYQRKWSLSRLNRLQKQPLKVLNKLLKVLQKKALQKMEALQREFAVLGTLSKMESFNYYQMIRFIKSLKQLINQLKLEQNGQKQQKLKRPSFDSSPQVQQKLESSLLALTQTALRKKFNNIDDECRKVKFIDYLELLVKKHRQKNIYLYLSTISDSRKFLKKIQHFTKQQANFLFGIDLKAISQYSSEKQRELLTNKVAKAYKEANRKNQLDKNVQDVFLEQMHKQRLMTCQNIELTPKISIKFYNVKAKNLQTKASLVADSIVDDLEKRKAFRGVIKKAKDNLMKNSKVKGVKIQVSGRLNGAEIARSEWVRAGRVPLQTLRANIDYCYKTANTIYGIIGVKVWIYKGYTQVRQTSKPSAISL